VALLALLIPAFGLAGAAIAVAASVVLEQALTVAMALRRFQVDPRALISRIWRPVAAASAMAAVLRAGGLGWSDDRHVTSLIAAVTAGAAVYTAVLLGSWLLAGRPRGAETDLMALLFRRRP
jgi:lipopolysaccharide exporter